MNVTVEDLAPCKKQLRFEVDLPQVHAAFDAVAKDFQRHAAMPGFRPGKAPPEMVAKKFESEISEEAKSKLLSDSYKQALKEKEIEPVSTPDLEEIQFGRDLPFKFMVTVETAPKFDLPEYRGLPARREIALVSEQDISRALDALRGQHATFQKIDREVRDNDFIVINYNGTCEGKPITDWNPVARGLTEKKNFWIQVTPDSFITGFAPQLIGAKAGEKRTVTVDFPADFITKEVAGKKGVYEVELVEVKERILPELNDEFAKKYEADNLAALKEGIRQDLQNELNLKQKRAVRAQVVEQLLNRVNFDLPESLVANETKGVVYSIVSENQRRGIPKEIIDQEKDGIYAAASKAAKDRVKLHFLFHKIADKEGIRVSEAELSTRILLLAQSNNMPPDKFMKELKERGGVGEVMESILHEKIVDFLHDNSRIEDVPAQT